MLHWINDEFSYVSFFRVSFHFNTTKKKSFTRTTILNTVQLVKKILNSLQYIKMENIHSPRLMYVDKVPLEEQSELGHEEKGTLTLLNSVSYETKRNMDQISCCKFDRTVPTTKNKSYESEKGEFQTKSSTT